jgi:hypothetical protein
MIDSSYEKAFTIQAADRAVGLDPYLSSTLFLLLSIASGRVWRYPFDDESYSLDVIHHFQISEIFWKFFAYDYHPPLSYATFALLHHMLPEWGLHAFSVALCTLSIYLMHTLVLARSGEWSLADRMFAFIAFAIIPLFLQLGDAIRWYPIFVLLTSLAVFRYYYRPDDRLSLAVLLGLLSLVGYVGYLVLLGFLLFRYAAERVRLLADKKFVTAVLLGQLPSLTYLYGTIFRAGDLPSHRLAVQGILEFTPTHIFDLFVGLVGGHSIGLGNAWTVVPLLSLYAGMLLTFLSTFRRNDRIENLALCVIMGALPLAASGHSNAYSYFQVAIMLPVLLVRYFNKLRSRGSKMWVIAIVCLANISAVANLQHSSHPFRRSYPAPYGEIVAAIDHNFTPRSVLLTTDENIITALGPNVDCVFFFDMLARGGPQCPITTANGMERPPDAAKILILDGRENLIQYYTTAKGLNWPHLKAEFIGPRRVTASVPYGIDSDAALKSRLTGTSLSRSEFMLYIYE